jgi:hypothetical protein
MYIGIKNYGVKFDRKRFQAIYDELPSWIKPTTRVNNVHHIEFDNGSRIIWRPCVEHTARGMTINFLYMDELAFGKHATIIMFLQSVLPALAVTGKMLSLSTYNADNPELSMIVTGPLDVELSHDDN